MIEKFEKLNFIALPIHILAFIIALTAIITGIAFWANWICLFLSPYCIWKAYKWFNG